MGPSFPDMIFLFLLALVIFGPKKLPEIGRQIGKIMNELRRASNEFKAQIQTEMDQVERQETARKMLAPSQPPPGAVATLSIGPTPPPPPEATETTATIDLEPIATSSEPSNPELDSVVKATNG